jgi:hypothetical protein
MKIYLDYDGTLCDLPFIWIDWVNKTFDKNFTLQDVIHYDYIANVLGDSANKMWRTKGCYTNVTPFFKSQFFVDQLKIRFGEENVKIITCSPPGMEKEKDEHIKYFYNIDMENVVHTCDKYLYTHDGILIDDAKHHIINHINENNQYGILFDYNEQYGWSKLNPDDYKLMKDYRKVKVMNSYREIIEFLENNCI